jgi:hypothetical protein
MPYEKPLPESSRFAPSKLNEEYPDLIGIVGTGRSGTTYLLRVLSSIGGSRSSEMKFTVPYYRKFGRSDALKNDSKLRQLLDQIDRSSLFAHTRDVRQIPVRAVELVDRIPPAPTYTQVLYATIELLTEKITPEANRLVYKHPPDVLNMPLIAEILPTVRFIHIIRDARAVAISMEKQMWGSTNLYSGAYYWARVVARGHRVGQQLGDRYLEIRYEDLFLDTEATARKLTKFVTQSEDDAAVCAMMDFIRETGNVDRVQDWQEKLSVRQRRICEAAAGPVLRQMGYPIEFGDQVSISPVSASYYLASDFSLRATRRLKRLWSQ